MNTKKVQKYFGQKSKNTVKHTFKNHIKVPFASRLTPYYVKAEILKVRERYDMEILLLTHKIVHKNCPSYLTDFVTLASDTSVRTTRAHKFKLRTPRVGVDAAENSFVVKSSRLWNDLPE
jgi:hypothetical protein